MGLLVNGEWHDEWYNTKATEGRFVRQAATFRDWIRADGSTPFRPEADRYHLYVSRACPWAHRCLVFRRLKGLESIIGLSIVDPLMLEKGWVFSDGPGSIPDTVNQCRALSDLYVLAKPDYTGRVTVPVLWDKRAHTIVNNESSEIIRMFNSEFDELTESDADFYPPELRVEIEAVNETVYETINNGVYKCGFATTQKAYEEAFDALFASLDAFEARLAAQRYLVGSRITEADWRLFTTLVRFDAVYYSHFKCNLRRIADYPHLWSYVRELYQWPGVAETVDFDHIKRHYYGSQRSINPTRIVPKGPALDFTLPHDRARLA
jgi:putative glutathione S-transferase